MKCGLDRTSTICAPPFAALPNAISKSYGGFSSFSNRGQLLISLKPAAERISTDEVIARLIPVRGIGRWTAQMFLMFRLGRPDVLPELDLGVQNAIQRAYGLKKRPLPKDVLAIGEKWRPYASVASWYLWRSLEGDAAM